MALQWSTLYRAFLKCLVSWVQLFHFNLALFIQSARVKVIYFRNFTSSSKEAVTLLLSWQSLYLAISECIVSLFYFYLYCFATFHPKWMCTGAVILLRSWSSLYIAISEFAVLYFCLLFFWFVTITQSEFVKVLFFLKF